MALSNNVLFRMRSGRFRYGILRNTILGDSILGFVDFAESVIALLRLAKLRRDQRLLGEFAVLRQTFQFGLELRLSCHYFLGEFSVAASRSAASSSMFSESRSIFAIRPPVRALATGNDRASQAVATLIHNHELESQSCGALIPFAPQMRTPMLAGHESTPKDGHERTIRSAGARARGNRSTRGKFQSHSGKIQTRARGI